MSELPNSIRTINSLEKDEKEAIYRQLIPRWLLSQYGIEEESLTFDGHSVINYVCPSGSRAMEMIIKRRASDLDPLMYLNMADTFNNQLLVLLVVVNDPDAPRYHVDVDSHGNNTNFGTTTRNIPAELDAMKAGMAPAQVRKGLRAFKSAVPLFEDFVGKMGHELFLIEPLAYHNAIVFEKYGFSYIRGLKDMMSIHQAFMPDGELHRRLTPNNPFRHLEAWRTIRGRSWAIHDGILGHPFTGFQMYKRIGVDAQVNTFPDAIW